jgi:hypothetical protein
MACESELGECKFGQEAVDIRLQEYPRRLRLSTVEKRISTMQGIEGRYEPVRIQQMEKLMFSLYYNA